ncbi:hypothetical protein SAMD00023353_3900460 [Rosellinia necatrix]|uniref:Uncharacterized protein n=1 Tax=Rosellinia necatrix TaxID=77044 RepID=A0A1S7UNL7_ROSNE|nr:hypothetical protein SAMD00023353_3900460 [Rosellinia necatrix]
MKFPNLTGRPETASDTIPPRAEKHGIISSLIKATHIHRMWSGLRMPLLLPYQKPGIPPFPALIPEGEVIRTRRRKMATVSKILPREMEKELRTLVIDPQDAPAVVWDGEAPRLTLVNPDSGCAGIMLRREDGDEFVFYHRIARTAPSPTTTTAAAAPCGCFASGVYGDVTRQLPQHLDAHRLELMLGEKVRYRLSSQLAAMVALKLFLGMDVPEPLRIPPTAAAPAPAPTPPRTGPSVLNFELPWAELTDESCVEAEVWREAWDKA